MFHVARDQTINLAGARRVQQLHYLAAVRSFESPFTRILFVFKDSFNIYSFYIFAVLHLLTCQRNVSLKKH